jgi:D-3-phosphoglycerate dehydrogenase
MRVIANDKYIPPSRAEELGIELIDDFDVFLPQADYFTIHVPLTDETRNLIGKEQFAKMKPTAVVLNISRGEVINEKDLYKALLNKRIGGACIDVYSKEPATKEEFPFITLDNIVVTPHLGASTQEAQMEVGKLAADHVMKALRDQEFPDAVN